MIYPKYNIKLIILNNKYNKDIYNIFIMAFNNKNRIQSKSNRDDNVYMLSVITKNVILPIVDVGKHIKNNLEKHIKYKIEGKCIPEGYIKPNSINILTYSAGKVNNGFVEFTTVIECLICHPVEGMVINCTVKTITKAGIHAEFTDEHNNVPLVIFIAKDHHYENPLFANVKETDKIKASIIGCRFELNDPNISAIASLV